ncbi:MAG TPA: hypothetical protein VGB14_01090 [Acidimicrobiales bacterium]
MNWLEQLAESAPVFPNANERRPYWSQRSSLDHSRVEVRLPAVVRRVRRLIDELEREHLFSEALGFECVDGNGRSDTSAATELERRVRKAHLLDVADEAWSADDLCDFLEVFHDMASRPTRGWEHDFCNCGWHPTAYSKRSGQALYRWRVNEELANTSLGLRMATDGEDIGRMVRVTPPALAELESYASESNAPDRDELRHAVAMYRSRGAGRNARRSAVIALARLLEDRRQLLKRELFTGDEQALFNIANNYDLRHRGVNQRCHYDDAFLDWVFHWYLATIRLADVLSERNTPAGPR